MRHWSRTKQLTFASIAVVVLAYAVVAFQRRWMADDGLIIVRTVRQFLDGAGPTFNVFERSEPNTSTLWTYILIVFAAVSRLRIEYLAVFLGLLLSVAALYLGMDGTRRMLRARGTTGVIAPAAALVVVGAYPFWDYATSGLETGLSFAWIALCWWLLVRGDRHKLSAFIFGLGPLVRPDLGVGSIVFFVVFWVLHRPTWRGTLKLAAIGMALPIAYEVFRVGYYGALVPLPAIAKSATESHWGRGIEYLLDYNQPYFIWVPFVVALLVFVQALRTRLISKRELILIAAPVVTGVLNAIYVLRVGGDFMHARMLLVPTFAILLPAFVLPIRRFTIPAFAVLSIWCVATIYRVADGKSHATRGIIEDERAGYVAWTAAKHPIHSRVFIRADRPASTKVAEAVRTKQHVIISDNVIPMSSAHDASLAYVVGRLGTGGAVAPLDGFVVDTLGLSNPLGARITPTLPGYTGHEKVLPWAWIQADYGDPSHDAEIAGTSKYVVAAARRALQCGELKELMDSVRAPMTASRFWQNLVGSVRRTRLVIPSDPVEAEQKFCQSTTLPVIAASNVYSFDGWSKYGVVDGIKESIEPDFGFTTRARPDEVVEWMTLSYGRKRSISKLLLYPAMSGEAFPLDFEIQIWDGTTWITRAKATNHTPRGRGIAEEFALSPPAVTDRLRIYVTKMRTWNELFTWQLAEIEVVP